MYPFLTIPIVLPGADGVPESYDKTVDCKLQPISILAYHAGYSWGTFIYLQTGQAFCSPLTVEELEAQLKGYYSKVFPSHPVEANNIAKIEKRRF